MDRRRARDAAEAARFRAAVAQQADHIALVVVERQVLRGVIAPRGRILVGIPPFVAHVDEQVGPRVLRERVAEVRAQAPVDQPRALQPVPVDVEAADQHDAGPVLDLLLQLAHAGSERPEGEVRGGEGNLQVAIADVPVGRVDGFQFGG